MAVYECLKEKLYHLGVRIKKGERVEFDSIPTDGKGNSLLDEKSPSFRLVSGVASRPAATSTVDVNADLEEAAKDDPRTRKEMRDDIMKNYGTAANHRMSRVNLLALEQQLEMLQGKDAAAIGTNDEMTLQQAEDFLK